VTARIAVTVLTCRLLQTPQLACIYRLAPTRLLHPSNFVTQIADDTKAADLSVLHVEPLVSWCSYMVSFLQLSLGADGALDLAAIKSCRLGSIALAVAGKVVSVLLAVAQHMLWQADTLCQLVHMAGTWYSCSSWVWVRPVLQYSPQALHKIRPDEQAAQAANLQLQFTRCCCCSCTHLCFCQLTCC
jgi:hypothetical protein